MYLKRKEYQVFYNEGNSWNISSKRYSTIKKAQDFIKNLKKSSNPDNIRIETFKIYSENKPKKMAKKSKKPLSAYKVKLSFKSKAGKTFTKGFLSLSSAKRAVAGWKSAGGQMAGKMKMTKSGKKYRSKKLR